MKKKSASQSAFFNLRILIALFIVSVGAFLALAGSGVLSASSPKTVIQMVGKNKIIVSSEDPLVPAGFDCSKIRTERIDRQENMRAQALMIACGEIEGGSASSAFGKFVQNIKRLFVPQAFGSGDVDLVTGAEPSPNITQSETFSSVNPDNPNEIFVAYNDSRGRNASPINISGASISTDGGTTFTRITTAGGQSPFTGTVGDPVALYNKPTGTWVTVWLDTGCGSQGLGGYKSSTPANAASWTHFCVHTASNDDRESGWADNNPGSPFYGRMYVSWGATAGLVVTYSSDNGSTWHAPITVAPASPFIRDVQITGDMSGNGVIYLAGMDEGGGGFPHNDINHIFKSTDGGNTWSHPYTGPAFQGPGVTAVGYFACMFSDGGGYWRHEGWGQPAAFNNVVSLVYAQHGAGSDAGDVYYIRSTDGGATFAVPFKLNSDATTRPQWQPNLSVSPTGTLFATWYDARDSANCTRGNPAVPCYKMYSRKSNDNGASWLPDDALSDVVSPLPAQNDPGVQATYAGDYDYGSAVASRHVTSWADGRVAITGTSQQDAFTDRELVGFSVTTANPACGTIINTQPTDFAVNLTDPVNPATVQGSDFTVNGIPANSVVLSNGNATITFHFNSTPVTAQGVQTMHMAANAINRASDNQGNLDFTCTFRFDALQLQVTTTNPPVGGNFSGPSSPLYDVNFNEALDPASVQTSDLTLSGVAGSVTNVQLINGNTTARFTLNLTSIFSGTLTANIAAGTITDAFGNPNAAFSGMYSYTGNFCPTFTQNFDAVAVPALPSGWTADQGVNAAGAPLWQTSNSGTPAPVADSAPNAAFSQDPGNTCDNRLYTPTIMYSSGAQLTFRQNFDLEQNSATIAYDAGVLEISINGGAYTDIISAGGSWVTGGYTHTGINSTFSNPLLPSRPCWSGISSGGAGGFMTTTVSLPASGVGMPVKLRWRMGSDSSVSHAGWRVDSVAIYESCQAPAVTSAVSRKTHGGAGDFDVTLPLTGTPGVECRNGQGAGTDHKMVVTFVNPISSVSSAAVTSGTGSVSGSPVIAGNVVTVNLTGVTNAQTIMVTLNNVNDGSNTGNVVVPMSVLKGDTNNNKTVNAGDVTQTKVQVGTTVGAGNFRTDVNVNGSINAGDVTLVKSSVGTSVP
ncbi:MAG TPA: dockerin type I domain-containing protein [Candidatus Udaeobacter sp.]|jgi:hypothetical protein|nr:dockerin type I domain-containing protein [Candidatus Udaeobacter sp.]